MVFRETIEYRFTLKLARDMIITCSQYKYVVKEKKTTTFITDDIEISSDDSERENLDDENSNEEN